ncbi:MAG: hypothetical protein AAFU49_03730 [Pseudomonadota bacterium]
MTMAGQAAVAVAPTVEVSLEPVVEQHRIQTGIVVDMPEIAALDCDAIRRVLARLDQSDYRNGGVLEAGHPDHRVFLYEDALASAYYTDCILNQIGGELPSTVFLRGFDTE